MIKRAARCAHFNGIQHKRCEAGIDYRQQFGEAPGLALRMPCFTPSSRKGQTPMICEHHRAETQAEIDADEAETAAFFERVEGPLRQAKKWRDKAPPWRSRHEVLECAACGGRLHLTQSAYNGHVHGRCETDGCARWME